MEDEIMLKIGVSTNNECGCSDVEILDNIASAGFKNVMLSFKTKSVDETIDYIGKLGIDICYFHINNRYANELWATGDGVERYIQSVIDQLEICGKYGIPIAVMHSCMGSPTNLALSPNEQGLKNFQKILSVAKKNNVKIALENVDCYSFEHLCYLLDNIKDEFVGFCYDIGHHHLYNPQIDLLKKYGDRLLAIHLHDNLMDWQAGYDYSRDLHLLPFDGNIDFAKVCEQLRAIDYQGVIMLELHKKAPGNPQLYETIDNLDYLKEAYSRAEKLRAMLEKF